MLHILFPCFAFVLIPAYYDNGNADLMGLHPDLWIFLHCIISYLLA